MAPSDQTMNTCEHFQASEFIHQPTPTSTSMTGKISIPRTDFTREKLMLGKKTQTDGLNSVEILIEAHLSAKKPWINTNPVKAAIVIQEL